MNAPRVAGAMAWARLLVSVLAAAAHPAACHVKVRKMRVVRQAQEARDIREYIREHGVSD